MKAIHYILLAALWTIPAALTAVGATPVELKWAPVRGAGGYRVEVRPESGPVIRRGITASNISLRLKPGAYQVRITVLNKFGRPAADSGWRPLRVRLAVKPDISAVSRAKVKRNAVGQRIRIRGKNFLKQTIVRLRGPDGVEHQFETRVVSDREISLVINEKLPQGKYDVIVQNPGAEPVISGGAFAYRARRRPSGDPSRPAVSPPQALWRSALIPGWGQFLKDDHFKTALIAAGHALPLALLLDARHQYNRAGNNVRTQEAVTSFVFLDSSVGTEVRGISFLLADNVRAAQRQEAARFRLAGVLTGAFYFYNLWDAWFAGEPDEIDAPGDALWRSAVLPGWGQSARGESMKGAILLGGAFVAAALMADSRNDYLRNVREKDLLDPLSAVIPIGTDTVAANIWFLQNTNRSRKTADRFNRRYRQAGVALAGIYLYGLFDAWFNHGAGDNASRVSEPAQGTLSIVPLPNAKGGMSMGIRYGFRF